MSRLLIAYHDLFTRHDAGPDHPERPERVTAVMQAIDSAPWRDRVDVVEAREAVVAEITAVHDPRYVDAMRRLCDAGGAYLAAMEATVGKESYRAALQAAGAGLTLADKIMQIENFKLQSGGDTKQCCRVSKLQSFKVSGFQRRTATLQLCNSATKHQSAICNLQSTIAFAPTRPPGHHAIHQRPMGFCIFNNIAILAKYLIKQYDMTRVGIIDFDVHHGNGTEAAFWSDPQVLYCSLHRENHFPYDKGHRHDIGAGDGEGFTINVPLPVDTTDDDYLRAFDRYIAPRLEDFAPEFVLVSAGFDSHRRDILGGMRLSGGVFTEIGERVRSLAQGSAGGRIISLLEGGYDLEGLCEGAVNYLGALLSSE